MINREVTSAKGYAESNRVPTESPMPTKIAFCDNKRLGTQWLRVVTSPVR